MNPALLRTLWHLKHWRDKGLLETLRQVERNQWLSADELGDLTWEKQKSLVAYAYERSSFYRRKYEAVGFQPGDLKSPEDFVRLPILTKEEIREHVDEMVAEGVEPSRLVKRFTGGSTGIPLMIYHDARAANCNWALYLRTIGRWDIRFGDKVAHIWGLNPANQGSLYHRQAWWQRALKNDVLLDAFDLTQSKMQDFAHLLRRFRPKLIISYSSALVAFAEFLEDSGGAGFSPQSIWLTAEVTFDPQRELIEQVFRAPVYDQYGSVEIPHYAVECSCREGLHIDADFRKVEVVDERGRSLPQGETGQIVVTDLLNYASPLIRYRNEDTGSLIAGSCSCGRGLPIMNKVAGRISDMFILPDGSQIHSERFTHFFKYNPDEVKTFQVHQIAPDRVVVRIVPTSTCKRESFSDRALESFREYTKGQVHFDIQFVDSISKEASGKYRFTKSDVSPRRG